MKSNPYVIPSVIVLAMVVVWLAVYIPFTCARQPAAGRHARPHHGRHEFADAADRDDPDGAGYVSQLLTDAAAAWQVTSMGDADWWEQEPPPALVEVLTGPATRIRHDSALTLGVLARVRDKLRELDDDSEPGEACPACRHWICVCGDGEPDSTLTDLHAVTTWGMTAKQKADELAAKYLAAPQ